MLGLWHVLQTFLGELVLLNVCLVQIKALLKHVNELIWWVLLVVPKNSVVNWSWLLASSLLSSSQLTDWSHAHLDAAEVDDVESAIGDHLVCNTDKQTGHSLVGVVVASNRVDHLDRVHQSWKGILNALWSSIVQWLDEFFEGLEVLDVVFRLVKSFSDT